MRKHKETLWELLYKLAEVLAEISAKEEGE